MSVNDATKDDEQEQASKILQEKLGEPVVADEIPVPSEEDIEKPVTHKEWKVYDEYEFEFRGETKKEIFNRTYIQKPLSYLAFGEFTGLLGRKLAEAMRGPDGLSLDRLTPGEASIPLEFNEGQVRLAGGEGSDLVDPIIQGIAKLASYVPDLMAESQCIWLRIPRVERLQVMDIWSRSPDDGGMSMDQGEEMLNIFIEQNYDELNNFLKRYARVKNTVQKMRKRSNLVNEG
jgi:hypothetical protein